MADFTNQLIINSIYHLLNFEKYPNFQTAAREAAIANNFQIVLFSSDFNPVFSVETRHVASIQDAARKGLETNINRSLENIKISVDGVTTYWGPVTIRDSKHYLMLVDNDDNYEQEEIVKLAEIIELAIGMWNYYPERDLTAELIRAVRRGNITLAATLLEELGIKENELCGVYLVPGAEKKAALQILVNQEKEYGGRALKLAETNEVAGIILKGEYKKDFGEPEWKLMAKYMSDNAGAPKTFHVMGTTSVEKLCAAFKLINETEAFVQLIFPQKHSFSKYELALANNCVSICMQGGSVKKYYQDLIAPLRSHSPRDTKSKQLTETLECFMLDSGMNAAKTASLMHIHANTVQYRIKRIREILGVDITGNTIVPGLMMALAVSRIEKEVKSF